MKLLSLSQVQEILGVSRQKVYQMATDNEIPVIRIGKSIRVPEDKLKDWIDSKLLQ